MKFGIDIRSARGTPKEWEDEYDRVGWINPDYEYAFVERDGKYGMVDKWNKTIIPIKFDDIDWPYSSNFSSGLYIVGRGGKYGIYKSQYGDQSVAIPLKYKEGQLQIGGKSFDVTVYVKGGGQYKEENGEWVLRDYSEYDQAVDKGKNRLLVKKGDKFGIIDKDKNIILPIKFDKISDISRGDYYIFHVGKKKGLFSFQENNWLVPPGENFDFYRMDNDYTFVFTVNGVKYQHESYRELNLQEIVKQLFTGLQKYQHPGY